MKEKAHVHKNPAKYGKRKWKLAEITDPSSEIFQQDIDRHNPKVLQ